jgi:hypothetical protein
MHASRSTVNIPELIDGKWRLLARSTGLIAQRNTKMRACTNLQEPTLFEIGNLTFPNLDDYIPSSDEGRHLLCWVLQKELTSVTRPH